MTSVLSEKVLVLNKNFFPLCVVNIKTAIRLIFAEKAEIMDDQYTSYTIESWQKQIDTTDKQVIRTPNQTYALPEVIKLTEFDQIISKPINLTRQNIFLRDDYECQYCGASSKLTIDHVIPKSRIKEFNLTKQQMNSWENMTTSCQKCNNKKDNKTPKEAGMKLTKKPKRPTHSLIGVQVKKPRPTWDVYLMKGKK